MEKTKTVTCPLCRTRVVARSSFCRRCGTSLEEVRFHPVRRSVVLGGVFLLVGGFLSAALFPLELYRVSIFAMGFACLGSGGALLWASLLLLTPPGADDLRRNRIIEALEAARIEPLPLPARGEFIDRFLAARPGSSISRH
jgi:hypothetical protein